MRELGWLTSSTTKPPSRWIARGMRGMGDEIVGGKGRVGGEEQGQPRSGTLAGHVSRWEGWMGRVGFSGGWVGKVEVEVGM